MDQSGEVFIDRDGARFAHVLNYLRDGKLNVDSNRALIGDLWDEAKYFGLEGMRELLEEELTYLDEEEERRDAERRQQDAVAFAAEFAKAAGQGDAAPEQNIFTTEADF